MNLKSWTRTSGSSRVAAMNRASHQARCQGLGPRPIRSNSSRPIATVRDCSAGEGLRLGTGASTAPATCPGGGSPLAAVSVSVSVRGAAGIARGFSSTGFSREGHIIIERDATQRDWRAEGESRGAKSRSREADISGPCGLRSGLDRPNAVWSATADPTPDLRLD